MKFGRTLLVFMAIVILIGTATEAAAGRPHDRNGFFLGFGLGGGSGKLEIPDGETSDWEGGGVGNFRLGWAVMPNLTLGLEGSGFARQETVGEEDVTFTFGVGAFGLTFYPGNQGLYIKGGVGFGQAKAEAEEDKVTVSIEENGIGFLGALGYEWRLTDKFALGPQAEYVYLNIDSDFVKTFNYFDVSLQLSWYW